MLNEQVKRYWLTKLGVQTEHSSFATSSSSGRKSATSTTSATMLNVNITTSTSNADKSTGESAFPVKSKNSDIVLGLNSDVQVNTFTATIMRQNFPFLSQNWENSFRVTISLLFDNYTLHYCWPSYPMAGWTIEKDYKFNLKAKPIYINSYARYSLSRFFFLAQSK